MADRPAKPEKKDLILKKLGNVSLLATIFLFLNACGANSDSQKIEGASNPKSLADGNFELKMQLVEKKLPKSLTNMIGITAYELVVCQASLRNECSVVFEPIDGEKILFLSGTYADFRDQLGLANLSSLEQLRLRIEREFKPRPGFDLLFMTTAGFVDAVGHISASCGAGSAVGATVGAFVGGIPTFGWGAAPAAGSGALIGCPIGSMIGLIGIASKSTPLYANTSKYISNYVKKRKELNHSIAALFDEQTKHLYHHTTATLMRELHSTFKFKLNIEDPLVRNWLYSSVK